MERSGTFEEIELVAGRSPEVAPVPDADFAAHRVLIMRGDRGYIDTILNELLALLP